MRFISRKEARARLGGVSPSTFWRMQKNGLLPQSVNAPGRPLREDEFTAAMESMAASGAEHRLDARLKIKQRFVEDTHR